MTEVSVETCLINLEVLSFSLKYRQRSVVLIGRGGLKHFWPNSVLQLKLLFKPLGAIEEFANERRVWNLSVWNPERASCN